MAIYNGELSTSVIIFAKLEGSISNPIILGSIEIPIPSLTIQKYNISKAVLISEVSYSH